MKCPNCGNVTNWDTLQCSCGYDAEHPAEAAPTTGTPAPVQYAPPHSLPVMIGLSVIWTGIIGLGAIVVFCVGLVGVVILSLRNGHNSYEFFGVLFLLVLVAAVVLLIGGIHSITAWRPKPSPIPATPAAAEAAPPTRGPRPRSALWKLCMSLLWLPLSYGVSRGAVWYVMFVSGLDQPQPPGAPGPDHVLLGMAVRLATCAVVVVSGLVFILNRPPARRAALTP